MKKNALVIASVLLAVTGCGRGWLPCLHRGAPCMNGTCSPDLGHVGTMEHASNVGCEGCGTSTVGYESYPVGSNAPYSTINRGTEVVSPQYTN